MTANAQAFAAANAEHPVVAGQWLDAQGRHVTGHPRTWRTLRYVLDGGQTFDLGLEELPLVDPRWGFETDFPDCHEEENPDVND